MSTSGVSVGWVESEDGEDDDDGVGSRMLFWRTICQVSFVRGVQRGLLDGDGKGDGEFESFPSSLSLSSSLPRVKPRPRPSARPRMMRMRGMKMRSFLRRVHGW